MMLNAAIETYVTLKCALEARFASDRRILKSFARLLGNVSVETTEILSNDRSPLQPFALRTLLLVLYGAGLRPGFGM